MGNRLQTCCSDTKDTKNEINREGRDDEDSIGKAKAHVRNEPAPYIEEKSHEIFDNQELSVIKNADTPNEINNLNGNFNSDVQFEVFHKKEFKPDEAMISNFLVNQSEKTEVNLEEFMNDKVKKAKSSRGANEIYSLDFSQVRTQPEFNGENIVELPSVYLDMHKKNEIYKGSWIIYNSEIQDGEEIKRYQADISFKMLATKNELQDKIDEIIMSSF